MRPSEEFSNGAVVVEADLWRPGLSSNPKFDSLNILSSSFAKTEVLKDKYFKTRHSFCSRGLDVRMDTGLRTCDWV